MEYFKALLKSFILKYIIDKYDDAEYDFTAVEYIDLDSLHNPDSTYLMKNTSLASFTDKIVQEKFLAN